MDTGGFAMYTDTVLVPWWEKQKNSWSGEGPFPAKRLLVVCDNASVHKAEELREKLEQHGIILRFLPPNMTAWLQPLDLVVCGLIKTLQRARRGSWRFVVLRICLVDVCMHYISASACPTLNAMLTSSFKGELLVAVSFS